MASRAAASNVTVLKTARTRRRAAAPIAEFNKTPTRTRSRYDQAPSKQGDAQSLLTSGNALGFKYDSLDEAFPAIDPGIKPLGAVVLVQIRQPKRFSAGGVELVAETRATEYYNTQVAKVIALGPLCFKTVKEVQPAIAGEAPHDIMVPYVEGAWFELGEYVRVPRYGGDRFAVEYDHVYRLKEPGSDHFEPSTRREEIIFCLFKAKDILGVITGDPLKVKAFLD